MMKIQVGELKANFSLYLKKVQAGEEIAVSFGKKNETMAYLIPVDRHPSHKVKLGLGAEQGFGYSSNGSFSANELKELFDID